MGKVDAREEIADKLLLGDGLLVSVGVLLDPLDDFCLNFGILASHQISICKKYRIKFISLPDPPICNGR